MSESGLRAFGGGPLIGSRWLRALYLDETGIGKLEHGPVLVLAGVLIHADLQWRPISECLRAMIESATPRGESIPSHLHAADIYAGRGDFAKDRWPEPVRFGLLDAMARLPFQFGVPVVWGSRDRAAHATACPDDAPLKQLIDCYAIAAMTCFMQTEWYMRNHVDSGEVCSITIEQNNQLQKRVKEIYHAARSASVLDSLGGADAVGDILPLTRIIDAPNFQDKTSSSVLQLADFCAWAIRRAAGRLRDHDRFVGPLTQTMLLWRPDQKPAISAPVWSPSPFPNSSMGRAFLGRSSPLPKRS